MRITLEKIVLAQLKELQEIAVKTFDETFATQNTPENMLWYYENNMHIDRTRVELLNSNSDFYFVNIQNQRIGYLKLNFNSAQSEAVLNNEAFEIERIYIKNEFQGKGYGSELFNAALNLGKEKGYNQMWLGVWEHNEKALLFYKRKGLATFDQHVFQLGNDPQTDLLMQLRFN